MDLSFFLPHFGPLKMDDAYRYTTSNPIRINDAWIINGDAFPKCIRQLKCSIYILHRLLASFAGIQINNFDGKVKEDLKNKKIMKNEREKKSLHCLSVVAFICKSTSISLINLKNVQLRGLSFEWCWFVNSLPGIGKLELRLYLGRFQSIIDEFIHIWKRVNMVDAVTYFRMMSF